MQTKDQDAAAARRYWRVEHAFAEIAAAFPDHVAIEVGARHYTLAEIAGASDRVAAQLAHHGAAPGAIVAIAVANAADFVIAALAVLKTGAAYLAIDLRQSLSRAREVLDRGVAALVLADGALPAALVPEGVTRIDGLAGDAALPVPQPVAAGADDVAYVCFTSGSTGQPKGVVVRHAGIRGLVFDPAFRPIAPGDRVAQTCTYGFDAITLDAWGATLCRGCLIDVPPDDLLSPARFAAFLRDRRIAVSWFTTGYFNALASRDPAMFASLDTVMIGGEAADAETLARVFASGCPPRRLINGYGPTEATTLATWHLVTAEDARSGSIPIGIPIAGRSVALRDVDADGIGELVIAGEAVALGYLGDPVRTAERFLPDAGGGLCYCTGDRCRIGPGGVVHYHGRSDDQVKVRGYRVELAAVTAALSALPGVAEAVTLAVENGAGSRSLLGVVRGTADLPPVPALKALLAERLPDYMVPARVLAVAAMPLTAAGKIDRAQLVAMATTGGAVPAQTATEARLIALLQQTLRMRGLGRDDRMVDIATDSLATVEVLVAIEAAFGVMLSPDAVGAAEAVHDLAAVIDAAAAAHDDRPLAVLLTLPWSAAIFAPEVVEAIADGGPVQVMALPPAMLSDAVPVATMAADVVARLRAVAAGRRIILVGYSYSGTVAQHAAVLLQHAGIPVDWLVLIDTYYGRMPLYARIVARLRRAFARQSAPDPHARERQLARQALRAHDPVRHDAPTLSIRSHDPLLRNAGPWRALGSAVTERRVAGDHLSVMTDPCAIAAMAALIRAARQDRVPHG